MVADRIFRSASGKLLADQKPRTLHFGMLVDTRGEEIDQVVASIFRAPHSFTGEDVVELTCHGSAIVQREALRAAIDAGARMAGPGEFTKRAFLAGKLDLVQAEAVADLIASNSKAARRVALSQLKGGFSGRLASLHEQLLKFTSLLELELDFPDEDVEFADRTELNSLMASIIAEVDRMAASFRTGDAIRNGVPTVIVGAPNAGKSTLLNALVGDDRAIVSDIEGTTRDSIEELATISDTLFRFIDTAGIRETDDRIESLGIERTMRHIGRAQIVLLLVAPNAAQEAVMYQMRQISGMLDATWQHMVVVATKNDVGHNEWLTDDWVRSHGASCLVSLSARSGDGLGRLGDTLTRIVFGEERTDEDAMVTNVRHYEALTRASVSLGRASESLRANLSGELVAQDLHEALDSLGSIVGKVSSDDVLHSIFQHFCIGK